MLTLYEVGHHARDFPVCRPGGHGPGLHGLLKELPFAGFVLDVAEDAWERWRGRHQVAEMRAELQEVAQLVTVEEVRRVADQVSAEVAANQPPAVRQALSLIPCAVRQSLKRPEDPTGTTVPSALPLARPEDMLMLLPQQPPQFQPVERPAALGGWELVGLLGVGGFGEVWLARNASFPDMRAAVKFCLDAASRQMT